MIKVLLDENLPNPLARKFSDQIEISTVSDMGWANKKNGELVKAMVGNDFDILLTADKGIPHQQNLKKYPIKILLIRTRDTRMASLLPFVDKIEKAILTIESDVLEVNLKDLQG
jgi:predicted nuclease of predicted toxin-antitoxin system